ncbi:MAG TPA: hypothetical protein VM598_01580, partial [Bdellovibrionota bacterium]|nr:hypothetical protein [Bdellovibrionota bacterium]
MVRLLVLFALPFAALSFDSSVAWAARKDCRDALSKKSEPDPILNAIPQDPGLKSVIALIRDREAQARASEGPVVALSKRTQRFRAEWLPHLKADRGYREALTRSMESDLRIRSSLLKKKLAQASRQGQPIRYDAVIVGASVAGLVTLHKLLAEEPTLRVLIVDSSDTAGAIFRY